MITTHRPDKDMNFRIPLYKKQQWRRSKSEKQIAAIWRNTTN